MNTALSAPPTERVVWVDHEGGMIVDPAVAKPIAIVIDRVRNETDVTLLGVGLVTVVIATRRTPRQP